MAGRLHRAVLALSFPAIIAIVSLYWARKRKKGVLNTNITDAFVDTEVVADNKCFDCSSTNANQCTANMQLRESSASNVCVSETTKCNVNVSNHEVRSVNFEADKNKCNAEKVNFFNGNEDKKENSCKFADKNLTYGNQKQEDVFSHLSASCAIQNNRKFTENESHNDCDSADDLVDNCKQTPIEKKHVNINNHINETDRGKVDADNATSLTGATVISQCNHNPKAFENGNNNLLKESVTEHKTENASENQDPQFSSKSEGRKRCESSSNGYATGSEISLQLNSFSDIHSEGSSDSGKGGSDIQGCISDTCNSAPEDQVIIYQFELPQELCGRLIGKQGHYVNSIKNETNARVVINRHPYTPYIKICSIEGTRSEIKLALQLIRRRFPVREYPEVTLQQINVISPIACPVPVPQSCQLHLPDGVSCDVILSSMVNAGHIFLQQPTHPTYPSLSRLDQFMTATYALASTPSVPNPTPGIICAVSIGGGWYRAVVVNVCNDECEVKFVDYGGYSKIPISSLRQIRFDFMTLPFQASECYLANVQPINENGWTPEANSLFEELAQGQILQANIVGYAEDGIPFVNLHKIQGASTIFINKELVDRGYAQWTCVHS